jgi:hypothetical protein
VRLRQRLEFGASLAEVRPPRNLRGQEIVTERVKYFTLLALHLQTATL